MSSLELKLENQILNSPFVLFDENKEHIEQLEILAKQLVQEAFWKQQTLQNFCHQLKVPGLKGSISKTQFTLRVTDIRNSQCS